MAYRFRDSHSPNTFQSKQKISRGFAVSMQVRSRSESISCAPEKHHNVISSSEATTSTRVPLHGGCSPPVYVLQTSRVDRLNYFPLPLLLRQWHQANKKRHQQQGFITQHHGNRLQPALPGPGCQPYYAQGSYHSFLEPHQHVRKGVLLLVVRVSSLLFSLLVLPHDLQTNNNPSFFVAFWSWYAFPPLVSGPFQQRQRTGVDS